MLNEVARQEFERVRNSVHTAPKPEIEGAPEWLNNIESMRDFFNSTASLWDSVFGSDQSDPLYMAVAEQVEATDLPIQILILGCGTGLELKDIFSKAPKAQITGIDLAPNMLAELRRKFINKSNQIKLIEGSYLDVTLGVQRFDYVVATLTVHHLSLKSKAELYKRIHNALKPEGRYIEGDQSVDKDREQEILYWYDAYISKLPGGLRAEWNYDVTLCPETEETLLREAGFKMVCLTWQNPDQSLSVFVADR